MGEYIRFLRDTDIFYDLSITQLERIKDICEERNYQKDDLIFGENAHSDELYIIVAGQVNILLNPNLVASKKETRKVESEIIATLREGQSFGEIALVDQGIRSASARAGIDDTRLLFIRRDRLLLLCNSAPEMGYRIMYNLALDLSQKMRNADLRIREALLYQEVKTNKE
ncbi:MAG: cyclic nucleotide-binding domain-containing protein [Anaerolineaceae bacterium]|jgi:CRP-like cAMP-binding protein